MTADPRKGKIKLATGDDGLMHVPEDRMCSPFMGPVGVTDKLDGLRVGHVHKFFVAFRAEDRGS